jgi:hypothetical protein
MTHKENPPAGDRGASNSTPSEIHTTAGADTRPGKSLVFLPCTWRHPQDVASQLRRRREASYRLPRLCDRCGARDPLLCCRCHEAVPPLSEGAIDGWRAAIERTLPIGPPIVPLEVLQRLWGNGGSDRALALRVWEETGGLVA